MMTRIAILLTVVFAGGVGAWTDVSPVNTFVDSGIIYASDHNENDSALASSINELEDTVDQYYMRWTDVEDGDSTLSRINADTIDSNPYMDSAVIDEIDINGGAIDGTVIGANSAAAGTFVTLNTGHGTNELYSMNQDVETTDGVTFSTVNTGQGANELYDMNQNVQTTDAVDFATVNTGQGDNEVYAMNQDVQTTDDVTFASVTVDTLEPAFVSAEWIAFQMPGDSVTEIDTDTIVATSSFMTIAPEGGSGGSNRDTLSHISTASPAPVVAGSAPVLIILAPSPTDTIYVSDGTGLRLTGDFMMDDTYDRLVLMRHRLGGGSYIANRWVEISRSDNE